MSNVSLCSVVNTMIVEALKSGNFGEKYSFSNTVWCYIRNETTIPKSEIGHSTPVKLLMHLYETEGHMLPLYGFDGDVKSLHKETQVLIKLGFAHIFDGSWLQMNVELSNNMDRLALKAAYVRAKHEYNTMLRGL